MDSATFAKVLELEDEFADLANKISKLQKQVDTNEVSLRQMAADLIALKK
jgi:hypothetical protein